MNYKKIQKTDATSICKVRDISLCLDLASSDDILNVIKSFIGIISQYQRDFLVFLSMY